MKFRTIVFLIVIGLLVVAWLTKPSTEDFKKFRESGNVIDAPPVIEVTDAYVYSLYTVSYYNIKKVPSVKLDKGEASIAVPVQKQRYLGLFGRFWKLD